MDAGNIFIYRTIVAKYKNVNIVTELEAMATLAFLVQDNDEVSQKTNFYASKPFASGEIYVGSLLDSLMCQAYYIMALSYSTYFGFDFPAQKYSRLR